MTMQADFRPGRHPALVYGAFLALCLAVAAAGSLATSHGLADWYPRLAKPWFNPPNWLFGPVWTVLYLMIAAAGARLVLSPAPDKGPALAAYAAQLALNAAWSWVFFYAEAPGAGLAVILALVAAVAITVVLAWPKDRMASVLLMPYLAWVGFATLLNAAIWRLNG